KARTMKPSPGPPRSVGGKIAGPGVPPRMGWSKTARRSQRKLPEQLIDPCDRRACTRATEGQPMSDADVVVVGAAVAGAALANALGSRGVDVLLLEKASRDVHSTRGDLLHPPTLEILDSWGVLARLHADGALPITHLAVSHAQRGLIAQFPVAAAGQGPAGRTIAVPHDRIESILF